MGVFGHGQKNVRLIDPQALYENSLSWSKWEFKKNALYLAGQDFKDNAALVDRKGSYISAMTILVVLEVMCLGGWVLASI